MRAIGLWERRRGGPGLVLGFLLATASCSPGGTSRPPPLSRESVPVLITRAQDVEQWVGHLVTLRGEVANAKIATLLGVDVASVSPDLRGRPASATGILRRYVLTRENIDAEFRGGPVATRGPGTYYFLEMPGSGRLAHVESLP